LNLAVKGEPWAVAQVSQLTEPVRTRPMYGGFDSEEETRERLSRPRIVLIRSDGAGHICEEDVKLFELQNKFPATVRRSSRGRGQHCLPPED